MGISDWIKKGTELGWAAFAQASQTMGAGYGYLRESISGAWLFGSTESSDSYDDQPYDEKHYFLIPFQIAESGYSLYSMRCLPEGVPPINDLPKRRIFHMPNSHAGKTVEQLLIEQTRESVTAEGADDKSMGNRLIGLADQIDKLDDKMFNGALVVGGLVALINPLVGAGIAAKALIPSVGMLLSKFGLKYAGESFNERSLVKKIRKAEKDVLKQFRGSDTDSFVNPLLEQLGRALRTDGLEFDPLVDVHFEETDFGSRDRQRMLQLSYRAISNVYRETLADRGQWPAAGLGPEDVRWLQLIERMAADNPAKPA